MKSPNPTGTPDVPPRVAEVGRLFAEGWDEKRIAEHLGIKVKTVRIYKVVWRQANGVARKHLRPKGTLAERMDALTDKNGPIHPRLGTPCWLFIPAQQSKGYGQIYDYDGELGRPGMFMRANRVAWMLANRTALIWTHSNDLVVRHKCDDKSCVNPDHLETGTQEQNIADALERNRFHSTIDPEKVREVRRLRAEGGMPKAIAKAVGPWRRIA